MEYKHVRVKNRSEALEMAAGLFKKWLRKYGKEDGDFSFGVEAFESTSNKPGFREVHVWCGPIGWDGEVQELVDSPCEYYVISFKYRGGRRVKEEKDEQDSVESDDGQAGWRAEDAVGGGSLFGWARSLFDIIVDSLLFISMVFLLLVLGIVLLPILLLVLIGRRILA